MWHPPPPGFSTVLFYFSFLNWTWKSSWKSRLEPATHQNSLDPHLNVVLCLLQTYSSLQDVLVSFGRRVSCFPLYRHFALVTSAIRDAAKIFQSGEFLHVVGSSFLDIQICTVRCECSHVDWQPKHPQYPYGCIWLSRKVNGGLGSTAENALRRQQSCHSPGGERSVMESSAPLWFSRVIIKSRANDSSGKTPKRHCTAPFVMGRQQFLRAA